MSQASSEFEIPTVSISNFWWLLLYLILAFAGFGHAFGITDRLGIDAGGGLLPVVTALLLTFWIVNDKRMIYSIVLVAIIFASATEVTRAGFGVPIEPACIMSGAVVAFILPARDRLLGAFIAGTLGVFVGTDLWHLLIGAQNFFTDHVAILGGSQFDDGVFIAGPFTVVATAAFSSFLKTD